MGVVPRAEGKHVSVHAHCTGSDQGHAICCAVSTACQLVHGTSSRVRTGSPGNAMSTDSKLLRCSSASVLLGSVVPAYRMKSRFGSYSFRRNSATEDFEKLSAGHLAEIGAHSDFIKNRLPSTAIPRMVCASHKWARAATDPAPERLNSTTRSPTRSTISFARPAPSPPLNWSTGAPVASDTIFFTGYRRPSSSIAYLNA